MDSLGTICQISGIIKLIMEIVGHFEFDQVEIFQGISSPETAHFVS